MPVAIHAQIGEALRTLMNGNGFSGTKLIGYEHNWDDAATYPVQLVHLSFFLFFFDKVMLNKYCSLFQMEQAGSAFDGVSLSLSLNALW